MILTILAIAVFRGLKIGAQGSWLEVPGPNTKVLRETQGSRVYLELESAQRMAEKLGDLKAEILGLKSGAVVRAMDRTETKLKVFFAHIEELLVKAVDDDDPIHGAVLRAVTPILGNLRRSLMDQILKPSFIYNGFYEYRSVGANSCPGDSREWEDYIDERVDTIKRTIRHDILSLIPMELKKVATTVADEMDGGVLSKHLHETIYDIFDHYWKLHHTMKTQAAELEERWYHTLEEVRAGQAPA